MCEARCDCPSKGAFFDRFIFFPEESGTFSSSVAANGLSFHSIDGGLRYYPVLQKMRVPQAHPKK